MGNGSDIVLKVLLKLSDNPSAEIAISEEIKDLVKRLDNKFSIKIDLRVNEAAYSRVLEKLEKIKEAMRGIGNMPLYRNSDLMDSLKKRAEDAEKSLAKVTRKFKDMAKGKSDITGVESAVGKAKSRVEEFSDTVDNAVQTIERFGNTAIDPSNNVVSGLKEIESQAKKTVEAIASISNAHITLSTSDVTKALIEFRKANKRNQLNAGFDAEFSGKYGSLPIKYDFNMDRHIQNMENLSRIRSVGGAGLSYTVDGELEYVEVKKAINDEERKLLASYMELGKDGEDVVRILSDETEAGQRLIEIIRGLKEEVDDVYIGISDRARTEKTKNGVLDKYDRSHSLPVLEELPGEMLEDGLILVSGKYEISALGLQDLVDTVVYYRDKYDHDFPASGNSGLGNIEESIAIITLMRDGVELLRKAMLSAYDGKTLAEIKEVNAELAAGVAIIEKYDNAVRTVNSSNAAVSRGRNLTDVLNDALGEKGLLRSDLDIILAAGKELSELDINELADATEGIIPLIGNVNIATDAAVDSAKDATLVVEEVTASVEGATEAVEELAGVTESAGRVIRKGFGKSIGGNVFTRELRETAVALEDVAAGVKEIATGGEIQQVADETANFTDEIERLQDVSIDPWRGIRGFVNTFDGYTNIAKIIGASEKYRADFTRDVGHVSISDVVEERFIPYLEILQYAADRYGAKDDGWAQFTLRRVNVGAPMSGMEEMPSLQEDFFETKKGKKVLKDAGGYTDDYGNFIRTLNLSTDRWEQVVKELSFNFADVIYAGFTLDLDNITIKAKNIKNAIINSYKKNYKLSHNDKVIDDKIAELNGLFDENDEQAYNAIKYILKIVDRVGIENLSEGVANSVERLSSWAERYRQGVEEFNDVVNQHNGLLDESLLGDIENNVTRQSLDILRIASPMGDVIGALQNYFAAISYEKQIAPYTDEPTRILSTTTIDWSQPDETLPEITAAYQELYDEQQRLIEQNKAVQDSWISTRDTLEANARSKAAALKQEREAAAAALKYEQEVAAAAKLAESVKGLPAESLLPNYDEYFDRLFNPEEAARKYLERLENQRNQIVEMQSVEPVALIGDGSAKQVEAATEGVVELTDGLEAVGEKADAATEGVVELTDGLEAVGEKADAATDAVEELGDVARKSATENDSFELLEGGDGGSGGSGGGSRGPGGTGGLLIAPETKDDEIAKYIRQLKSVNDQIYKLGKNGDSASDSMTKALAERDSVLQSLYDLGWDRNSITILEQIRGQIRNTIVDAEKLKSKMVKFLELGKYDEDSAVFKKISEDVVTLGKELDKISGKTPSGVNDAFLMTTINGITNGHQTSALDDTLSTIKQIESEYKNASVSINKVEKDAEKVLKSISSFRETGKYGKSGSLGGSIIDGSYADQQIKEAERLASKIVEDVKNGVITAQAGRDALVALQRQFNDVKNNIAAVGKTVNDAMKELDTTTAMLVSGGEKSMTDTKRAKYWVASANVEGYRDSIEESEEIAKSLTTYSAYESKLSNYDAVTERANAVDDLREKLSELFEQQKKYYELLRNNEDTSSPVREMANLQWQIESSKYFSEVEDEYKKFYENEEKYSEAYDKDIDAVAEKTKALYDEIQNYSIKNVAKDGAVDVSIYNSMAEAVNEVYRGVLDGSLKISEAESRTKAWRETFDKVKESATSAGSIIKDIVKQYETMLGLIKSGDLSSANFDKALFGATTSSNALSVLQGKIIDETPYVDIKNSSLFKDFTLIKGELESAADELSKSLLEKITNMSAAFGDESVFGDTLRNLASDIKIYSDECESGTISIEKFISSLSNSKKQFESIKEQVAGSSEDEYEEFKKEYIDAAKKLETYRYSSKNSTSSNFSALKELFSAENFSNISRNFDEFIERFGEGSSAKLSELKTSLSSVLKDFGMLKDEFGATIVDEGSVKDIQNVLTTLMNTRSIMAKLNANKTAYTFDESGSAVATEQYKTLLNIETECVEKLNQYKDLVADIVEVETGMRPNSDLTTELDKEYEEAMRLYDATKKLSDARKEASEAMTWTAAKDKMPEQYKAIENAVEAMNKLDFAYKRNGINMGEYYQKSNEQVQIIKDNVEQIRDAGKDTESLGDKFGHVFKSFIGRFSALQIYYRVFRKFKEMVNNVIEFNAAITDLEVVTGAGGSTLERFGDTAIQTAKDVGASVTDIIESTTTYARLGYSLDESADLAKYTAMLQNVGDIDSSSAQDAITSAIKAFGIDTSEIESTMDKLVVVGNNFPVSVSDLATGITNAGSMLETAGNSFEESIALIAAANVTVQDVSKASTGLRTIAARIRNTTTELDDLGESMTDAEYQELISTLTGNNVSLTDANGQFRSTYDILQDIAAIWDDIGSTEQAAIAETLAGTRQQNVLSSVLSQFDTASDAMEAMGESSGALATANETYMTSIEAHTAQFTAQWQELSNAIADSGIVTAFVDMGTTGLSIITALADKLGGLRTIVLVLAEAIGGSLLGKLDKSNTLSEFFTFKDNFIGKRLNTASKSISNFIKSAKDGFVGLGKSISYGVKSWFSKSDADKLNASLGFKQFTKNAFSVVSIITTAISSVVALYKAHIENIRKVNSELYSDASEAVDSQMNVVNAYSQYASVTKDALSSDEDLSDAVQSVTSALGEKADALDGVTAGTDTYIQKLKEMADAEVESIGVEVKKEVAAAKELIESLSSSEYALIVDVDDNGMMATETEIRKMLSDIGLNGTPYGYNGKVKYGPDSNDADDLAAYYLKLKDAQSLLAENDLTESEHYKVISEAISNMSEYTEDYIAAMEDLWSYDYIAENGIPDSLSDFSKYREAMIDGMVETFGVEDAEARNAIDEFLENSFTGTNWLSTLQEEENDAERILEKRNEIVQKLMNNVDVSLDDTTKSQFESEFQNIIAELSDEQIEMIINAEAEVDYSSIDAFKESIEDFQPEIKTYEDLSQNFGIVAENAKAAAAAVTVLETALEEDDYDTNYDKRVEYFEQLQTALEEGEYGSKEMSALKQYFLGSAEATSDEIEQFAAANAQYFTESSDGIIEWLSAIEQMNQSGTLDSAIASYDSDTGNFQYNINKINELGEAFGWTSQMTQDFIDKYRMYSDDFLEADPSDRLEELRNYGYITSEFRDAIDKDVVSMKDLQEYTGYSEDEVRTLVDALNEVSDVEIAIDTDISDNLKIDQSYVDKLIEQGFNKDEIKEKIERLMSSFDVDVDADINVDGEVLFSEEEISSSFSSKIKETVNKIGEAVRNAGADGTASIKVEFETGGTEVANEISQELSSAQAVANENPVTVKAELDEGNTLEKSGQIVTMLSMIDGMSTEANIDSNASSVRSRIVEVGTALTNLDGKTATVKVNTVYSSTSQANATGTKHAKEGASLLGDEFSPSGKPKPELVVSGDSAYLAGVNGPTIGYLNAGDIVYTYDETRKILGNDIIHGRIQAFAGGTARGLVKKTTTSGYTSGSSGTSNTVSSSTASEGSAGETEKTQFEKDLDYHKHLVDMYQETDEAYFKWLNSAFRSAYNSGEIELEDYYNYEKEVLDGLMSVFKDTLSDIEHEIDMRQNYDKESVNIIALYKKAMSDIETEIAAARKKGLKNTDDYIQELQSSWESYAKEIEDMYDEYTENAKDSLETLIDYRISMIEQEVEDQKEALDEKLDDLQEFYDKQRELLEDQRDEEEYLEDQAEKRKAITDIQLELDQLELDNSAWAQKKRLELLEELKDAQEELDDLESDYAYDKLIESLDDQQEAQEKVITDQQEALDESLEDQKALRDQALEDIRSNSAALYQEMIDWNNYYGDGISETITDAWEEAYIALEEYYNLYGKYYESVQLANKTGYEFDSGWESSSPVSGYASGTSSALSGLHRVDENGDEFIFEAANGDRYRLFSGGEKVLTANATQFLYDFANSGGSILGNLLDSATVKSGDTMLTNSNNYNIAVGDIVVNGNATEKTVSQIRREQRNSIDYILKEFGRLNK